MNQLKKYFEDFSSRACCFSDMRKYLALLDEQERQEVRTSESHIVASCTAISQWLSMIISMYKESYRIMHSWMIFSYTKCLNNTDWKI